jgi:excisionase family DNA binding protein
MAGMLEGSLSVLRSPEIIRPKRARRLYGAFLEYAVMSDQLLKVEQIAAWLSISKASLYRLVSEHRIPFFKVRGAGLRFDPNEIRRWIEGQRIGKGSK